MPQRLHSPRSRSSDSRSVPEFTFGSGVVCVIVEFDRFVDVLAIERGSARRARILAVPGRFDGGFAAVRAQRVGKFSLDVTDVHGQRVVIVPAQNYPTEYIESGEMK